MKVLKRLIIAIITFAFLGAGFLAATSLVLNIFFPPPDVVGLEASCGPDYNAICSEDLVCDAATQQCREPVPTLIELGIFPIEVDWVKYLQQDQNEADIALKLTNPNSEWGTGNFEYKIILTDANGSEFATIRGESYILPGQTKYITHPSAATSRFIADARVELQEHESLTWRQLVDFIDLQLMVENITLSNLDDHPRFKTRLVGTVVNRSLFGLTDIKVPALLLSSSGDIIGVNNTSIQTVLEGGRRDVEYFWTSRFNNVDEIIIEAYSNVYKNSNFILRHGGSIPEREPGEVIQPGFRLPKIFETIRRRGLLIF